MQSKVNCKTLMAFIMGLLFFMISTGLYAASSWSYQGNNMYGPRFDRPDEFEPILSGRIVPYHAQPFSVNNTTECMFYSAQDYDGFLLLYENSFDPDNPLLNLISANDDTYFYFDDMIFLGIKNTSTIWLLPVPLEAQRSYILVTSSLNTGESGSFENTLHCGGNDTVIVHGGCTDTNDGTAGCLQNDRFEFFVNWVDFSGRTGSGSVSPMGATDSANVYFFAPNNWELLIKVIDFCSDPNKNSYAVYFSATTNVEFTLHVRDTITQQTRTYVNQLGENANTVIDDFAFPCN